MRGLVIGAKGFIGRGVCEELEEMGHEIVQADRTDTEGGMYIDLANPDSIGKVLEKVSPDVIVNCAGIIENSEKAKLNVTFTRNLLEQVVASGITLKRFVMMGSAAEYGYVEPGDLPIKEDHPLNAESLYGLSKIEESKLALSYRDSANIPVVVARLFNPIGKGIAGRLLVPRIIAQIEEFADGARETIEVNRLDASRDYIHVKDASAAIAILASSTETPKHEVYNVGSGQSTSNAGIIEIILDKMEFERRPEVIETSDTPEPLAATQADISRLSQEFGWSPRFAISQAIEEIIDAKRR